MFNSALKKLASRFNPKERAVPSERLFVAAFGKHPGWDDHIDDIGLETDTLATVKRTLYVEGIGGNIDSGSWEKLQENQRLEEFRHMFVWCLQSKVVVGRMWPSRDGKGRTSYPMVVCVESRRSSLEWIVNNILPRLERVEQSCIVTTSATSVRAIIDNAGREFSGLAQQCLPTRDSSVLYPNALAKLADFPELGPSHHGLLRILYHIEREVARYEPDSSRDETVRPTLLRVPVSPAAVLQSTLTWTSFLLTSIGPNTCILVLVPLGRSWLDIIIGEPTDSQLYCLRAHLEAIPLTSSIPYNMGSDFVNRANQLLEDSRRGKARTKPSSAR